MTTTLPCFDEVSSIIRYCPFSGKFFRFTRQRFWRETGFGPDGGYVTIFCLGRSYSAGRVAWLLMTREWPVGEVDHRDLNKENNRWSNLRAATPSQNTANRPRFSNNATGFKGVSIYNQRGVIRYRARVGIGTKRISLGLFDDPEAAHRAYVAASVEHHKEFSRVE